MLTARPSYLIRFHGFYSLPYVVAGAYHCYIIAVLNFLAGCLNLPVVTLRIHISCRILCLISLHRDDVSLKLPYCHVSWV
jgi:hypothetical protein